MNSDTSYSQPYSYKRIICIQEPANNEFDYGKFMELTGCDSIIIEIPS